MINLANMSDIIRDLYCDGRMQRELERQSEIMDQLVSGLGWPEFRKLNVVPRVKMALRLRREHARTTTTGSNRKGTRHAE